MPIAFRVVSPGVKMEGCNVLSRAAIRIGAILADRRLSLMLAVLAPLLLLPALNAGFQFDDYFHRSRILGFGDAHPLQIFVPYDGDPAHNLRQMEAGTLPWWASTDLHLAFLRYGSTLSALLDYQLWPDRPELMHLHSLLWLSVVVVAATLVYRRVLGATWVAGLAAVLYAVDDAHALPTTYLANRNALIAASFGFLSIACFVRWRQDGRRFDRWLSALWLALGLCAGEMALATAGYLVSYAFILDHGTMREKFVRLLPHAVVLSCWALIYRVGGFGSHGSGFYLDPIGAPLTFATGFIERAPLLLMGQWTPIPAEMGLVFAPGSSQAMTLRLISLAVVVTLLVLFVPLAARDRVARFWALGVVCSLIPVVAVGAENRVLFFVGLGSMGLLAQLVQAAFMRRPEAPTSRSWRVLARTAAVILLPIHLLAAPALGLIALQFQEKATAAMMRAIASVPSDAAIDAQDLVLVNPPDHVYLVTAIPVVKELEHQPRPQRIRALSAGSALVITRVGPRSLRVRFPSGFFPSVFSRFVRGRADTFHVGDRIELSRFSVAIEQLDARGDPEQVLYQFEVPLEDPSLRWLQWKGGVYVPWSPPALGGSEEMPAPRGIFG